MKFSAGRSAKFNCDIQLNAGELSTGQKNTHQANSRDSSNGIIGVFTKTKNDFTIFDDEQVKDKKQHFVEDPHWSRERREQVRKFRFSVCTLALLAMTFGLMSRTVLNLAIVEMTKSGSGSQRETPEEPSSVHSNDSALPADGTTLLPPATDGDMAEHEKMPDEDEAIDWSIGYQNLLLSALYIGYAPTMLLSGNLAETYGSKIPLLIAILGSAMINLLTPIVARYSFTLLFLLRVLLGILQGGLVPSIYDLFNKWLTLTETSIFVSLVKVFIALGTLTGAMLPGIASQLGLGWPWIFYMASFLCIIWSLIWIPLATSTPQTNSFVKVNECQWIMRKKQPFSPGSNSNNFKLSNREEANGVAQTQTQTTKEAPDSTPWLLIITNSSVLALTLVKFTYNVGMDFFILELALYLRKVHEASTETISAVASGGALLQMTLSTLIGWLAGVLVKRRSFGLSCTKWRKIFQGTSNFMMALAYFAIPFAGSNFPMVITLIMVIFFFWLFGVGGESMVPYDLSTRYPATIYGFAHSFSVLAGVCMPLLCGLMLNNDGADPPGWNRLFFLIGSVCTFGGLVFCLVLRSKPFLPGEIEPKSTDKPRQIDRK